MKRRRLISSLLCLSLLLGLTAPMSAAAQSATNIQLDASTCSLSKGDTIQIVVSASEMTVSSFAGGVFFDTSFLECVSISGTRSEQSGLYLLDSLGNCYPAASVSSVAEANASGIVGFVWIGTNNNTYFSQEFAIITLRAVREGTTRVDMFENSAGPGGITYDSRGADDSDSALFISIQAEKQTNVSIASDKANLTVEGTVKIMLSTDEMTVSSFTTGIRFDHEVFECISIEGTCVENPDQLYLRDDTNALHPAVAVSSVTEANNNGTIGFAWIGTHDMQYSNQEFAVITLKAIEDMNTSVFLYEDSAGTNGKKFNAQLCQDGNEGVLNFTFHAWMQFADINNEAYYYDAVIWASENGITAGTDETHFSPNASCTRAQIVTFLWRAADSPCPLSEGVPFTDVSQKAYYYDAVRWAYERGITTGTSEKSFAPNRTCSRAEAMTLLWRFMDSPESSQTTAAFSDVPDDTWYADAVNWAVEEEITVGTSSSTFSPYHTCTRAQIVTFLYRALAKNS